MKKLTEEQETERGALLAKVLRLRRVYYNHRSTEHWSTTWGSKTDLGLYRTVTRLLKDGKDL